MKKRTYVFIGILIAFTFCMNPGTVSALGVEGAIGYWMQSPSGDISYETTLVGDRIDIEDDFNFDTKSRPYARLKLDLPLFLPNVYLMATPMRFTGSGNENFQFGDITISGAFDAELQLDQYDIGLYYSIPFLNTATIGKLNAEVGFNLKLIDFEASVEGTGGGVTEKESESFTVPLPMIYVGLQLKPVKALAVEVEARGIAISGNHFYDLIGRVKVKPIGPLFISGGYRLQDIKIDESDVKANLEFNGPFLEIGVEL